jgi:hypothetical protein
MSVEPLGGKYLAFSPLPTPSATAELRSPNIEHLALPVEPLPGEPDVKADHPSPGAALWFGFTQETSIHSPASAGKGAKQTPSRASGKNSSASGNAVAVVADRLLCALHIFPLHIALHILSLRKSPISHLAAYVSLLPMFLPPIPTIST